MSAALPGVTEAARAVASGEVKARELAEKAIAVCEARDEEVGAFLSLDAEGALAAADAVDGKRAAGEALSPLAGVPLAIKDNLCTDGLRTTCASKMLAEYVPPYDATAVAKLRDAGAVFVGKANMDEFAMGSSNENSAFKPCRNPWDLTRVPGGSSGGSAASVAAGMVSGALGSDTGGSVRQPAAFCGITAIKPTYGRVSRSGLVAFASSLDQIGPMARSVEDAARLLTAISGPDPLDATSVDRPVEDYVGAVSTGVKGLRVGVPRAWLEQVSDADVARCAADAEAALRDAGATIVDIALPHAHHALAVYYLVAPSEASSNLARFDGVRYGFRAEASTLEEMYEQTRAQGFGPEVKRRILLGTYALSSGYYDAFYVKAQKVRTRICEDFAGAFEGCDVVLSPTTPAPAFGLGEKASDPVQMYLADIFTLPMSLAGIPAVATPAGKTGDGLPVGVQLSARAFDEVSAIRAAAVVEAASGLKDAVAPAFV